MSDQELRERLEEVLAQRLRRPVRVTHLARRQSEYCASYCVQELDATLDEGTKLELVYKELDKNSMLKEARAVKPHFLLDPRREIDAYRIVLEPCKLDVAAFYGVIERAEVDGLGIVLERIQGTHLWQFGAFAAWEQAARWLAHLHAGPATATARACARLIRYDRPFYLRWKDRAVRFVTNDPARDEAAKANMRRLAGTYETVVDDLCSLPQVFVHGDYHPSNILCAQGEPPQRGNQLEYRVRPIDWEMAGVGPAAIDLAALTAGTWSDEQRCQMIGAYWNAVPDRCRDTTSLDNLVLSVEYARLHWAIRWLGWSERWVAPRAQARDWLAEALNAARRVGLNIARPARSRF
jgi:hypothetical protein